MAGAKSALPSRLQNNGAGGPDGVGSFKRNHHGKSQSHVVSQSLAIHERGPHDHLSSFAPCILSQSMKKRITDGCRAV